MALRANKFISETPQSQRMNSGTFGWIPHFSFRRIKRDLWGFPKYLGYALLRSKSDILCRNAKSLQPMKRRACWDRTEDRTGRSSWDTACAGTQPRAEAPEPWGHSKKATRKVVLWCRDLKDRSHFKRKHYVSSFLWIPFKNKIAPRIPLLLLCNLVKHHTPQLMAQLHSLEPLNEGRITPNNLFLSFMDR